MDLQNQFILFCSPSDLQAAKKNVVWIPEESGKYSLREHYSLAKQAGREGLTVFHSPHYTLPLLLKCKSIVTVHDLIHLKFREFFPAWKVRAAHLLLKKVLQKADAVITVSNTSRDDILEFFPETRAKLEVIYNRLSPGWFEKPQEIDISALGIGKDYLLYAGNFKKHKGIDTLIDAYSALKDPPQLVLVGKSADADGDLIERIFSVPGIRVLGFAEGNLLQRLFSRAMLFVFPSLYEGFGYPPLEAMSCGTPVLSSDAPALREILGDGVEFFQRGNAESLREKLEKLIGDSSRRAELSKRGMEHARSFMTDDSPRKLINLYARFNK
jgi:glycosyltransferase involved in cell wall biosynthesis